SAPRSAFGVLFLTLPPPAPLLRAWSGRVDPKGSPYRLYAVSIFLCSLVLLAFPILFEPHLRVKMQGRLWTAGYLLFAAAGCACAFLAARGEEQASSPGSNRTAGESGRIPHAPTAASLALWFALAATASIVFLAATNQLCQDIAVVPLLWVLPLAIYLLSFILCFEHPRWYAREWFLVAFPLALCLACFVLNDGAIGSIAMQITIYLAVLFSVCMACHGELARSKPDPRFLTAFYLAVAAGGAFGGIFVGLLAPRLFTRTWEFQLGLFCAAGLLLLILALDRESWVYRCPAPVP